MASLGQTVRTLTAGAALVSFADLARADDYGAMSEGRKLDFSVTLGATSDYVFRGISQTLEDPAAQGSVDLTYGIFYAGIWASNVDFGPGSPNAEIDLYAGFRPTIGPGRFWGPITFDFGVLYYAYPAANDSGAELDFVELKAGYSMESPWIRGLTSGTTLYWSPEYGGEVGEVFTLESVASYALPQVGIFSPSISGTWGTVYGDRNDGFSPGGTRTEDYQYWNAGLALSVEKFTFDFRYWDSDIDVVPGGGGLCTSADLCDERFVFTAKVTLP
jgi:uncharacterized protein (TIGR02001 family)